MQFVKSSLWATLVIVFKALGNIVINKMISAYYQSPQTFALLSHFQNLLGIYSSVPSDGINQGVIKYLSDKNISSDKARAIFYTGLWLNLLVFVLSSVSIIVFKEYFISLFAAGMHSWVWVGWILSLLFFQLLNLYFVAQLLAKQHLKIYALINTVSVVLGILAVGFALHWYEFSAVLIAVGIGPSSLFFVSLYIVNKYYFPVFKIKLPEWESFKKLLQFILMALSIMLFGRVVDFVVREYAMSEFSVYETGLWQAVVKFSDYYMAAFVSLIGMVYFPKISELVNTKIELQKYVIHVLKIVVPVSMLGLLTVYFLRTFILVFFFEEQFINGENYFTFQLAGDLLKMISYILGFVIIAEARTSLFIATQAFSSISYIVLVFLFTNEFGMEGFPLAHAVRYVLFTGLLIILYRKLIFA